LVIDNFNFIDLQHVIKRVKQTAEEFAMHFLFL